MTHTCEKCLRTFIRKHNLDHSNILEQAFQQEALMDDNKNLLFNFISSIKKKINIKSQLYQDIFASFVVGDKFDKTFLLMDEPPLDRAFEPILITTLFVLLKYSSLISLIAISIDIKNIEV